MFRAQSGGLSVVFESSMADIQEDMQQTISLPGYQMDLPYKVSCTQLRKTIRINLDSLPVVPVILYMTNGALMEGTVVDISTTGAKFRVKQDAEKEPISFQIMDSCKIDLPNDAAFQTGLQLLGVSYDEESNISELRCQFTHLKSDDEKLLESFINDTL
jgi:c-di-GMP-binding flagellar brake protein YcgR